MLSPPSRSLTSSHRQQSIWAHSTSLPTLSITFRIHSIAWRHLAIPFTTWLPLWAIPRTDKSHHRTRTLTVFRTTRRKTFLTSHPFSLRQRPRNINSRCRRRTTRSINSVSRRLRLFLRIPRRRFESAAVRCHLWISRSIHRSLHRRLWLRCQFCSIWRKTRCFRFSIGSTANLSRRTWPRVSWKVCLSFAPPSRLSTKWLHRARSISDSLSWRKSSSICSWTFTVAWIVWFWCSIRTLSVDVHRHFAKSSSSVYARWQSDLLPSCSCRKFSPRTLFSIDFKGTRSSSSSSLEFRFWTRSFTSSFKTFWWLWSHCSKRREKSW